MDISIAIMGLFVGFLVGLTGVGGAAVLTPILLMFGVNPSIAVGTDLIYNSVTKLFGTIQHWRQQTIDFRLARYLAYGSIPGAVLSIALLHVFDSFYSNQEEIIKHALGYVLIVVALATLLKIVLDHKMKADSWQVKSLDDRKGLTILVGGVLGFIVGLTSIGSGSLFALVMLYFFRISPAKLVGTDIAHAFLLVTVAGALHAGMGNVDYMLAVNLLLGSVPGVIIGSTLSAKAPTKFLRTVIASIILISGLKLI
ncbi:sulfite exporter TauE/SafE family protein [Paenibacillus xerothermodurans]|uniref:Probable membrane transporter protein n=1 Tax=Paenibacillus xerothermodurans TaxID=1977292 RepID=A0A2W1NJH3_PAEXE|nr:sulfite exporter TauE/SafE family protein [Paenibacillus xerothermodurans]PZE19675.1 sulfite exporter TauE/SafE family protein [Paenibacillus xerothermodurans]